MKIYNYQQRSEEWIDARKGKITGTKLKDIVVKRGTEKKIGFYELIADRLSVPTDEDAMERGVRLEEEAIARFEKETGKTVRQVGFCTREDNENIAVSPDGIIGADKITEHIEIKCLSSAVHLRAYFEKQIPKEYYEQVLQNFIVNDDLERLYFVFYDPRVLALDFHMIEVERQTVQEDAQAMYEYQLNVLKEVDELVSQIAF